MTDFSNFGIFYFNEAKKLVHKPDFWNTYKEKRQKHPLVGKEMLTNCIGDLQREALWSDIQKLSKKSDYVSHF